MENWLKFLIATACVVVIVGGGYYAKSEYDRKLAKEAADERAMVVFCKQMIRDLSRNEVKDYKGGHIAACLNGHYVTELDFQAANAINYVDSVRNLIK